MGLLDSKDSQRSRNKPSSSLSRLKDGFFVLRPTAWISLLWLGLSSHLTGRQIQFSSLESTYTGTTRQLQTSIAGESQSAAFTGRKIDFTDTETAFSNIPDSLALSYQSWSFAAKKTSMLGNLVHLAGTARVADHVEVVMVTWAAAANYPNQSAIDPAGYQHPVTATLYQPVVDAEGTLLGIDKTLDQITATVRIPWRPATLPNGSPYPYNGYAFKILIPLSATVAVPDQVLIGISFNTSSHGDSPLGISGPYDQLNLALSTSTPSAGNDPDPGTLFPVINGKLTPTSGYFYTGSPMFRLASRPSSLPAPVLSSSVSLLHAGTYHLRATVQAANLTADAVATILRAPAIVSASGLIQALDAPEPGIQTSTDPAGLETHTTYAGFAEPPTIPGTHPFTVTVTDPDYFGTLSGSFHLTAQSYDGWRRQWFTDPTAAHSAGSADPDSDSLPNRLEYALGSDPLKADRGYEISRQAGSLHFTYTQRREMAGISLTPEFSNNLTDWRPVDSTPETSGDFLETKSVTCPPGHGFIRLHYSEH